MNNFIMGLLAIFTTVIIYLLARKLYQKFPRPFTLPILIATIVLILGLIFFDIKYESYYIGAGWIEKLLGPAVVALAYPLYKHRNILNGNVFMVTIPVMIGSIVGVMSGIILGKILGFERFIILSLFPKSVTTPVAMDIAKSIGGQPSLAAVMVMIAGIGGAVAGPSLFSWIGVKDYQAKGLGMGSASHAIGTAMAMENSTEEGAVSTIAMILSAIFVSFFTPFIIYLFL